MIERGDIDVKAQPRLVARSRRDFRYRRRSRLRSGRDDAGGRACGGAGEDGRRLLRPGARDDPYRRHRPLCAMDGGARLRCVIMGAGPAFVAYHGARVASLGTSPDRHRGAERPGAIVLDMATSTISNGNDHAGARQPATHCRRRHRVDRGRRAHHRSTPGRNPVAARRSQRLGARL